MIRSSVVVGQSMVPDKIEVLTEATQAGTKAYSR
jgi:hypothetical protein